MNVLTLSEITKTYMKGEESIHALHSIDLSIDEGAFIAVVGPSGSGKTTLLNIVGCLDVPTSGTIEYRGEKMGAKSDKDLSEYRKSKIGFVFQSYNLIPVLTVRENIELPLTISKKLSQADARKKADSIIERVGLSGMQNRFPRELSGGQEQRVAVARALVKDPYIVLADEPTANLDSKTAEEIVELMRAINTETGATFLFSTHDPLIMRHANRVVTLHDGKIVSDERTGSK